MARVAKRIKMDSDKLKIKFDVPMLNILLKYVRCDNVTANRLVNLDRLIDTLDLESYAYSHDIHDRLTLMKKLLKFRIRDNIKDEDLLQTVLKEDCDKEELIIFDNAAVRNALTESECDKVTKMVNERLQTIHIFKCKDRMLQILDSVDNSPFQPSYVELINELKDIMSELLMNLQMTDANESIIREFSFSDEDYPRLLDTIVGKAKKPSAILQTGIRQLNALLTPGFKSGRLYTILGGTGKFKSGTLINIADQIRRFNPQVPAFENGRRKTVLYITMENSIEETLERVYDMYSGMSDELIDKTTEEVAATFKNEGHFEFGEDSGIDITMQYYGNLEIDTSRIYTIIRELRDRGKEPICIILDYIKRIDSTHPNGGDERVRMSYAAKELKNIANEFSIPVITAMQINREGNSILDAATRDEKEDLIRFVGLSNIGNCWDIVEDSDWVGVINLERQRSTNKLFLSMRRLKIRGKKQTVVKKEGDDDSKEPLVSEYFNHPFVNEKCIRLETDVDKEESLSTISLSTDILSIKELEELQKNKRPLAKEVLDQKRRANVNSVIKSIDASAIISRLEQREIDRRREEELMEKIKRRDVV